MWEDLCIAGTLIGCKVPVLAHCLFRNTNLPLTMYVLAARNAENTSTGVVSGITRVVQGVWAASGNTRGEG